MRQNLTRVWFNFAAVTEVLCTVFQHDTLCCKCPGVARTPGERSSMKLLTVQGCLYIHCQTLHQLLYKTKPRSVLTVGGSAAWDIYSLGANASTHPAWDCRGVCSTGCGALRGSSHEKRMLGVLHTSLQHKESSSQMDQSAVLKAELWEPQGEILT